MQRCSFAVVSLRFVRFATVVAFTICALASSLYAQKKQGFTAFIVGNPANDTNSIGGFANATFGQVTQAYRDTSTTNDAGGRQIQIVARINF